MVDRRQDALRGALTYLGDAERKISGIEGGHVGWALMEQIQPYDTRFFGPGARPPGERATWSLTAPVWGWVLLGGAIVGLLLTPLSLTVVGALVGAVAGLVGRFCVTLRLAGQLRRPSVEANAEIHAALGEAARFMHEAGVDWVGGDPSVVEHPWQMLGPVRATVAALEAELPGAAQS